MKKYFLGSVFFVWFLIHDGTAYGQTDVLMQHNDLNRTGWDNTETILNQSNVTPTNFGLLYKKSVDDQIYAQPLVASGVMINGVPKNIVYVATVSNTVYAFDADDGTLDPYWQRNFTPASMAPPNAGDIHPSLCGFSYSDFHGNPSLGQLGSFGIVGTPVIDKSTNTIYFVSRYKDPSVVDNGSHNNDPDWSSVGFFQVFHALDLSTGVDKFGSPVPISAQVNGTGDGSSGGVIQFDPRRENQRGGLVLSNGIVYIPYAGHCDMNNYHGWILGYQASNIANQEIRYVTTPNDGRGGVWMSGAAPAVDASGNLCFAVGNGANDGSDPGVGLTVVKAAPDLVNHTLDNLTWFQPSSYVSWNEADLDFATGLLLIPGASPDLMVTEHKTGNLVLLKQNLVGPGKFDESNTTNFLGYIYLGVGNGAECHSSITYFGGTTPYVYQFSEETHVQAYPVLNASPWLGTPITNNTVSTNVGLAGGFMSASSNGTDPSSAILWVTHLTNSGGAMHALKANDITQELWNSDANPIDNLGAYAKMSCASVANGKVYTPTFNNSLNVYGLLSASRCVTDVALNKTVNASSDDGVGDVASNAFDGSLATRWAANSGGTPQYIYVNLGQLYDICKVSILWNQGSGSFTDYAVNFTVDISNDGTNWTTINTVTGNSFTSNPAINEFNEHSTAQYVRMNTTTGGVSGTSIVEMYVYGNPASACQPPAAASLNATAITQSSATLNWTPVAGVSNYIVRYRPSTVSSYITRNVPSSGNPVTLNISALTCGFSYEFDVQSDCGGGVVSAASVSSFNTSACTTNCSNFQHFSHGDLGDIQAPGMSCYDGPSATFTITGAGSGFGGTGDQFQFNYKPISIDEEFIMRVASQTPSGAGNPDQAGIMMRDSVTDISRYIFIGQTGNGNISLVYRITTGGTATVTNIPNSSGAHFFRIVKAGTQYSAFYGNTVTGPWTAMINNVDLGFGTQQFYIGMGVSISTLGSTSTSVATFDNLTENTGTLPIQLVNFTATNVLNQYVSLSWQTSMEENNDHFDVERSTDGSNYVKITTVKAVGNSSTLQSYAAVDNTPANGINFYKLKQVDIDNRYSYSPVVTVRFGAGIGPVIYPNPVISSFNAVAGSDPILEMVLYNLQGKAVVFVLGNNNGDQNMVNISNLASGIYILKVKTISKDYQIKIVKE